MFMRAAKSVSEFVRYHPLAFSVAGNLRDVLEVHGLLVLADQLNVGAEVGPVTTVTPRNADVSLGLGPYERHVAEFGPLVGVGQYLVAGRSVGVVQKGDG